MSTFDHTHINLTSSGGTTWCMREFPLQNKIDKYLLNTTRLNMPKRYLKWQNMLYPQPWQFVLKFPQTPVKTLMI